MPAAPAVEDQPQQLPDRTAPARVTPDRVTPAVVPTTVWLLQPAHSPSETGTASCLIEQICRRIFTTVVPAVEPHRRGAVAVTRADAAVSSAPGGAVADDEGAVRLLLVDAVRIGRTPVGLDVTAIVNMAAAVEPGGVLAVVTVSRRAGGRLQDPRPGLVQAARSVGLDYHQHIVTTLTTTTGSDEDKDAGTWPLLADVSVFRRPHIDNTPDASGQVRT